MNIGENIKTFFLELSQDLINLLTSAENIKKYDVLIQSILDVLTEPKNSIKYDTLLQGVINKFTEQNNVEKYKILYRSLFETGAINAPVAGVLDAETNKKRKELEGDLVNKPLPMWTEPIK